MIRDNYLFEDGTLYEYKRGVKMPDLQTRAGYFFCFNSNGKTRPEAIKQWEALSNERDLQDAEDAFDAKMLD